MIQNDLESDPTAIISNITSSREYGMSRIGRLPCEAGLSFGIVLTP